jgi:signal transduction histidine kinase
MTVAPTSAITYHKEIKGYKENSQASIVFQAMKELGRGCTMRQIQGKTGMEINELSRSLNNLRTKRKVIDFFDALSTYNGKTKKVHHYFIKGEAVQTNLF